MSNTRIEEECIDYFRKHPVFDRLLKGFREKYRSYGSFSGTVVLKNLTDRDREDLEGFFRRNYHGKKSASVQAGNFKRALSDSRFGTIAPDEVLRLYFREELTAKKEQRRAERQAAEAVYDRLIGEYSGTPAEAWLLAAEGRGEGAAGAADTGPVDEHASQKTRAWLMKHYREHDRDPAVLEQELRLGAEMLNQLPCRTQRREYLAVFAARLTGNPHAFDDGTTGGQLLALIVLWQMENQNSITPAAEIFPAMRRQRQYLTLGIMRDDISNSVMLSGIRVQKRNGALHAGMEGFRTEGEPVQVPLSVVVGWERIECPADTIYIVENPSVFALLCQRWQGNRACMCMNGQPRLSAVLILDLLALAGAKVYYAGDFDPEGLLIAQKTMQYYELRVSTRTKQDFPPEPIRAEADRSPEGQFQFWHMSAGDCLASLSEETLSPKRMKMLSRITDPALTEAAGVLLAHGVAGYQENIYDRYSIG